MIKANQSMWKTEKRKKQHKALLQELHNKNVFKYDNFKGKSHTEEWKQNHSKLMKEKQSGSKNSQYGTMWITNGSENKKIKNTCTIPEGWYKGRTVRKNMSVG